MLYLSTKSSSGTLLNGDMKSDVLYDLKNYLMYEDDKTVEYITISVPSCVLVNSNYIINQYNNTLIINGVTYTFPYGNYTSKLFIDVFPTIVSGFTLAINQVTSRFTITKSSGGSFTILGASPISYIMGFSENITATGTYTFTRVCNFLPNATYQICVANGNMYNGLVLAVDGRVAYSNILASIPNDSKLNTQIVYQNNSMEFRLNTLSCDFLNIQIRDNNGNLVDFNGIATFFTLQINVHRKQLKLVSGFSDVLNSAVTVAFKNSEMNDTS
jgi:hypothetical protein